MRRPHALREAGWDLHSGWGTVAASSLVIGAIIALLFRIGLRTIGPIMAFGQAC